VFGLLEHYSQADFSTVRNRRAYLAGAAAHICDISDFIIGKISLFVAGAVHCSVYVCMLGLARSAEGCQWCVGVAGALQLANFSTVRNKRAYLAGAAGSIPKDACYVMIA
jgi:hypothetical protein